MRPAQLSHRSHIETSLAGVLPRTNSFAGIIWNHRRHVFRLPLQNLVGQMRPHPTYARHFIPSQRPSPTSTRPGLPGWDLGPLGSPMRGPNHTCFRRRFSRGYVRAGRLAGPSRIVLTGALGGSPSPTPARLSISCRCPGAAGGDTTRQDVAGCPVAREKSRPASLGLTATLAHPLAAGVVLRGAMACFLPAPSREHTLPGRVCTERQSGVGRYRRRPPSPWWLCPTR